MYLMSYAEQPITQEPTLEAIENAERRKQEEAIRRKAQRLTSGKLKDDEDPETLVRQLSEDDSVIARLALAAYGGLDITKSFGSVDEGRKPRHTTGLLELVIERPAGFEVPGYYYDEISKMAWILEIEGEHTKALALDNLISN